MIRLKNVFHEFKKYDADGNETKSDQILNDLTLDIDEGSFVAILGQNGSGKSTLAKHLNGLLLPTAGTVFIGEDDTKSKEKLLDIRRKVGMVFQNPDNQMVANVVEEDVGFGPENLGVETDEIWRRVEKSLESVGMWAYRLSSPNRLSGGQKQRVAIAGVMAMLPQYIVLDEPTAMLDPNGRKDVIRTIRQLNKEKNITVILITHYMEETIAADRVIVIDEGVVQLDGSPREVFSEVERLKQLHLDVPAVTELAYQLRKEGVKIDKTVLSVDEFVDEMIRAKQWQ